MRYLAVLGSILCAGWLVPTGADARDLTITAWGGGAPGAEGLSGLAKAFFFAGARSLLVSNWRVSSVATKQLMTDTMSQYVKAADQGKPEALQQAMLKMMGTAEYQHPFFWSAFVVVGD